MYADHIYLFGGNGGQDITQAAVSPFACTAGPGNMVGIVVHAAGKILPRRGYGWAVAPHNGGSGFAQIESCTLGIKGTAGRGGQCLERLEARNDELRHDIAADDHGMLVVVLREQAGSGYLCADARYAGIGNNNGRIGVAQQSSNAAGGGEQVEVVALGGGKNENGLRVGRVDIATAQCLTGRRNGKIDKRTRCAEQRGTKRLNARKTMVVQTKRTATGKDGLQVGGRGVAQRRSNIMRNAIHLNQG